MRAPAAIQQALAAARHLLEMHPRCLVDEKSRRQFQRLDRRLGAVADQLALITTPDIEEKLAGQSARMQKSEKADTI